MRGWSFAALLLAASCGGDDGGTTCTHDGHVYKVGDSFLLGDGCNSCSCSVMGIVSIELACATDDGIGDADPESCATSGGCLSGPACGAICYKQSKRCDNDVYRYRTNTAYSTGNIYTAAGPLGGNAC